MSVPSEHTIEIDRRYHRDRLMDIIGHPPGWLLRSGIGLMAFLTALLLCLPWYIRYPDIIEAPVLITSDHPPVEVYTNRAGIIDTIYVHDGEKVTDGQPLIFMDNTASLADIGLWQGWLESVIQSTGPDSLIVTPPVSLALGELHQGYTVISQKYQEWSRWAADQTVTEKIKANRKEIETIRRLMGSLQQQITIYDQELSLQQKSLYRDESLFKAGVISAAEYEKASSSYLVASRQKESIATGMLTHRMSMDQLESAILDQQITYDNQLLTLHTTMQTLCREALSSIVKWEELYIVRSQIAGTLSIPGHLVSHTYINTGEPLMAVLPEESSSGVYALAGVTSTGLGKIEIGDKVIIRLDAWPYKQYGSLISGVQQIALLPVPGEKENKSFELRMSLSSPILTTTGASLLLKPQESGTARIITRDRRILERLFDQLLQLTNINP
jgi:multidrug resistance efflux pump